MGKIIMSYILYISYLIKLASVWISMKNEHYFTIQLIFTIIHGSHCTFLVLFRSLTILFQLIFTFIYSTFNNKFSVLAK